MAKSAQDKNPQEEDLLNLVYCMRKKKRLALSFPPFLSLWGVLKHLTPAPGQSMPRLLSSLASWVPTHLALIHWIFLTTYALPPGPWDAHEGLSWTSLLSAKAGGCPSIVSIGYMFHMALLLFEQGMQRLSLRCHFGRFIQPTRVYRLPLQLMFWLRASVVWWIDNLERIWVVVRLGQGPCPKNIALAGSNALAFTVLKFFMYSGRSYNWVLAIEQFHISYRWNCT
jgi:hypothetical protein